MFVVKNKNPKDVIPPKIKQKIVFEYCTFLKRVMISLSGGGGGDFYNIPYVISTK